jgi:hypothetical protein
MKISIVGDIDGEATVRETDMWTTEFIKAAFFAIFPMSIEIEHAPHPMEISEEIRQQYWEDFLNELTNKEDK